MASDWTQLSYSQSESRTESERLPFQSQITNEGQFQSGYTSNILPSHNGNRQSIGWRCGRASNECWKGHIMVSTGSNPDDKLKPTERQSIQTHQDIDRDVPSEAHNWDKARSRLRCLPRSRPIFTSSHLSRWSTNSTRWSPKGTWNNNSQFKLHLRLNADYHWLPAASKLYRASGSTAQRLNREQALLILISITIFRKAHLWGIDEWDETTRLRYSPDDHKWIQAMAIAQSPVNAK